MAKKVKVSELVEQLHMEVLAGEVWTETSDNSR